jgi:hypothetical protein
LDLINIAKLGRQWFGESFDIKQDQEFEFNFPNIDVSTPCKIKTTTAAAYTPTSFQITSSGQTIGNISFPAITPIQTLNLILVLTTPPLLGQNL